MSKCSRHFTERSRLVAGGKSGFARLKTWLMLAPFLIAAVGAIAQDPADTTKLLRFPDIHGDRVVFSYGGDLWTAPSTGGSATRLTAHAGLEMFARFSPDGRWIAFTGQYDGDEQVYVMPATGGVPRQLTFYPSRPSAAPRHGFDNLVYGWTPDGSAVLFRSLRDADGIENEGKLYTIPVGGGLATPLPMPTSGAADFAPDGKRLVYSPLFRDFRNWKRYQGGWAQDLYLYDLASDGLTPVSHTARTERDPMWVGDSIYFVSDRDGTLNLFRFDPTSQETTQLTHYDQWDVRWASSDGWSRIVYELNGELRVYDTARSEDRAVPIAVPSDLSLVRPARVSAERQIEDFELSPKGERALFVARGDVFTSPIEHGPTRNLTSTSRHHDQWARWSPDGRRIAFISDITGEEQVYLIDQDGFGKPEPLTASLAGQLYAPAWSPDGSRLAFSDKDGKLYVLTIAGRELVEIADDRFGSIRDYAWAPGGGQLAFSMAESNGNRSLYIWDTGDGQVRQITDDTFSEHNPTFDPEGKYLYYLSDREFAPQISSVEWNYAGNRTTGIFALALRRDVPSPFPPRSDEVKIEDEAKGEARKDDDKTGEGGTPSDKENGKKKPEKVTPPITIDYEGLAARVTRVPVESENFDALSAVKGYLLYVQSGAGFYGRDSYAKSRLLLYDIAKREQHTLVDDVDGYVLSSDGSKALVQSGRTYKLWDVKPKASDPKTLSTKGLMVDRVSAEEFAEIFEEVWRRYRDWFYVENMHGYDWAAIREAYRPWVDHVAHRSDLNYLLGEMISELNVGHAYIQGGDFELPERPKVGLPGARFELDEPAGRYRVARILRGHNEEEKYRSPLTEVGVDVKVGDYVLAIDGVELTDQDNIYRLLRHKTEPITLTVNSRPALEGARKVTYRPIHDESALLYLEQIAENRERVARLTDGRAGYLHIPDMGAEGAYEFIKWYYPQIRKEGLVVDVRSNGGGNISQWIIERLDSELLGTRFGRSSDEPFTYPATVFHGHMVALINETSASDGDIFPYRFRQAGLGPLVGKRTWGGVVGISGTGPLIDGGVVFVPRQATNDPEGNYIIEGEGVAPDVVVDNDPASVIAGRDPQLERAVEILKQSMDAEPKRLPTRPPDPVKTRAPIE